MTDKSPDKLKYLVEKLAEQLGVLENNDKNVEVVYKNLIFKNKEYLAKNGSALKSLISAKLTDILTNRVIFLNLILEYKYLNDIIDFS